MHCLCSSQLRFLRCNKKPFWCSPHPYKLLIRTSNISNEALEKRECFLLGSVLVVGIFIRQNKLLHCVKTADDIFSDNTFFPVSFSFHLRILLIGYFPIHVNRSSSTPLLMPLCSRYEYHWRIHKTLCGKRV